MKPWLIHAFADEADSMIDGQIAAMKRNHIRGLEIRTVDGQSVADISIEKAKEAVKGLKSASGFIRRELGHRLKLRHVPELIFNATDSIEYSANISRILNSLDIKEDEEENDESV